MAEHSHSLLSNMYILDNKLLVVLDEVSKVTNGASSGRLRHLITSDTLQVTRKNREPITMPSLLRFIIISNNVRAVHTAADARRFLVLEVKKKEGSNSNSDFFEQLAAEKDNGGPRALLHRLSRLPPPDLNRTPVPRTRALFQVQVESHPHRKAVENWYNYLVNHENGVPRPPQSELDPLGEAFCTSNGDISACRDAFAKQFSFPSWKDLQPW